MFVLSEEDDVDGTAERVAMASALARSLTVGAGEPPTEAASAERARNLTQLFATDGGRELVFSADVIPDLRTWALREAAENPDWAGADLSDGWESPVVGRTFQERAMARLAGRGTEQHEYEGEALRTAIGQAIGLPPDNADAQTLDDAFYGENRVIDGVEKKILQISAGLDPSDPDCPDPPEGTVANVSVVPVTLTGDEFGAMNVPVFRVEQPDGTVMFVDHTGEPYPSFDEWKSDNELPPGLMSYPEGLQLGNAVVQADSPNDHWTAHVLGALDMVAMGVGIVAGVALVVGTGGTAGLVLAAGGAAVYSGARAGERLHDGAERGHDPLDWRDDQTRANLIDLGSSVLSVAGMAGGMRVAQLAARSQTMGRTGATVVAGLQVAGNSADVLGMGNAAVTAARNWDRMTDAQKAQTLLQIAFQGGMMGASTRASGASLRDGFDLPRLRNQIEFGTPYGVRQVDEPGFPEGSIRVRYQDEAGSTITPVIEANGRPDPGLLALHTAVGRQIEAGRGLRGWWSRMRGDAAPAEGTVAHETLLEIGKIEAEARLLADQLPIATPQDRDAIGIRLDELATATRAQQARLQVYESAAAGWVASPSRGAALARTLHERGVLSSADPPEGHHWRLMDGRRDNVDDLPNHQVSLRNEDGTYSVIELRLNPGSAERALMFDRTNGGSVPHVPSTSPRQPRGDFDNNLIERDLEAIRREFPDEFDETQIVRLLANSRPDTPEGSVRGGSRPNGGVVSLAVIGDEVFVGVNSHNHPRDALTLQRDFDHAHNADSGIAFQQMVYHAEAESLLRAHARMTELGRSMPEQVTLTTDLMPCGMCRQHLGALASELGVNQVRIEVTDGSVWTNTGPNGAFVQVPRTATDN